MGVTNLAATLIRHGGASAGPDVTPGVAPAWAVVFRDEATGPQGKVLLSVGSETHDGSVSATLPQDLAGGTYQIVVEGLSDEDYARIRQPAGGHLLASLHLWWDDAPAGILGDLARASGFADPLLFRAPEPPRHSLVSVLRVDTARRRAGERRVETVVSGRELVVARLTDHRVQGLCYLDLDVAARAIARDAGVTVLTHGLTEAAPGKDQPDFANVGPGTALEGMTTVRDQARDALRRFGLPLAMIRDGVVHIGVWTAFGVGDVRSLDESTGLVAVERGAPLQRRQAAGEPPPGAPRQRPTVTLTALGRPDLKPGDIVTVPLPPEDFPTVEPPSFLTALTIVAGPVFAGAEPDAVPSRCRVTEVTHRLSRRQGFVTTVQATVLADDDDGWDSVGPEPRPEPTRDKPTRTTAPTDGPTGAARAVQAVLRDVVGAADDRRRSRVALVHDHVPGGTPRHTSEVWYADVAPDGRPAAAQRTQITERHHGELREVPYVTPFGWGNFGLVLPRYPGTRVLLVDGGGGTGDLVDVGALWPRDSGPPAAAGDYWLVLPVGVDERTHLVGDPTPADGPATHDLIDGDGTRLVETARFVVRVTDQLTRCTERPKPGDEAPAGSIVVETKPGDGKTASIRLHADGSIVVSAESITFDTAGRGDIALKANNVLVTVGKNGKLDVS